MIRKLALFALLCSFYPLKSDVSDLSRGPIFPDKNAIAKRIQQMVSEMGKFTATIKVAFEAPADTPPNIHAFATDSAIIFNPKKMEQLSPGAQWFVAAHEAAHIAKKHSLARVNGTDPIKVEIEADEAAVAWLCKENMHDCVEAYIKHIEKRMKEGYTLAPTLWEEEPSRIERIASYCISIFSSKKQRTQSPKQGHLAPAERCKMLREFMKKYKNRRRK